MAEVPGSMLTWVTFCCCVFFFSHNNACDANIAIFANYGYFVKNSINGDLLTVDSVMRTV